MAISIKEIMESFSSSHLSQKPEWYVLKDGHHIGPVTHEKVMVFFESGEVTASTLVWKGGNVDWLPIKELKEFNTLFSNIEILPSIPDLREIEQLAKQEIDQNFPKPSLKKTTVHRSKKLKSGVIEKYKLESTENVEVGFESKIDLKSGSIFDTQELPELPIFKLPEIPALEDSFDVSPNLSTENLNDSVSNVDKNLDFKKEKKVNEISGTYHEKSLGRKRVYQLTMVIVVALMFLIPSIIYLQKVSPFSITISTLKNHQTKMLEKTVNSTSVERVLLTGALDEKNRLFLAVNRKSPIKIYGKVQSVPNQVTSLNSISFYFKETSKNGLIEIRNPRFEKDLSSLPTAGKYLVDFQVEKIDKISIFINSLKRVFLLSDLPFIKNYQIRSRFSDELIIGKGSANENERLIADFLKNRNQYIEKPVTHLTQQLKTLSSIGKKFKEIFFNATTLKKVSKSRKVFARQFGRELAPILQVITLSNLSEVELERLKLSQSFLDVFDSEFERTKLISREISGLAAFVDKRFSEGGTWFSGKRIKHRSLVNSEIKKVQEQINTAIKIINDLKEKFLIKI
jgi:hypothetical protein